MEEIHIAVDAAQDCNTCVVVYADDDLLPDIMLMDDHQQHFLIIMKDGVIFKNMQE